MHFEVPERGMASIKEFAKQFFMIVVSILTALGFEQSIENVRHARAAQQAQQHIEAELRENLAEIKSSRQSNVDRLKPLEDFSSKLMQEIKAGSNKAQIYDRVINPMLGHFQLGVTLPTLRHEAWDVAVANQSVAYVNDAKLRQYSAAYAAQRDGNALAAQSLTTLMNGQQMIAVLTDAHLGIASPIDILHVVEQMKATIESSQGNLSEMEPPLNAALSNISPTAKH